LEPLNQAVAVFETPEPFCFPIAANTRHSCLSVAGGFKVTVYRKIQQLVAANASCCGLLVLLAPAGLCLIYAQILPQPVGHPLSNCNMLKINGLQLKK
jgi:hypothetical protein